MRPWLLTAPWWALFLLNGSVYVLGLTLVGRYIGDENWTEALVSAVPFGVLFGAVMGPIMARNNRRFREAAGVLSPGRLRQAARLSRRGPVPVDPELRQAARRVALQERGELVRQRWWAVPFFASALVLALWLALTTALAWPGWLLVAVTVPPLAAHLLLPRQLARRAELLAEPPE